MAKQLKIIRHYVASIDHAEIRRYARAVEKFGEEYADDLKTPPVRKLYRKGNSLPTRMK